MTATGGKSRKQRRDSEPPRRTDSPLQRLCYTVWRKISAESPGLQTKEKHSQLFKNRMADRDTLPLPLEVRARLAELELELSEGDITQKGYEKKRAKLIGAYLPQPPGRGAESSMAHERRPPLAPSSSAASRYHRRRSSGSRDERYRSDVHTEAVQAALAKHKERKMAVPMPSKRRSLVVQTSMDAYTLQDPLNGLPGRAEFTVRKSDNESDGRRLLHGIELVTSSVLAASSRQIIIHVLLPPMASSPGCRQAPSRHF
ncbi:hypothetical protein GJAV_G00084290 [Gymnothorax javanicus]|nr:hypothetical protein GJAV_G00084290 [Gymnothorax javanicus]